MTTAMATARDGDGITCPALGPLSGPVFARAAAMVFWSVLPINTRK